MTTAPRPLGAFVTGTRKRYGYVFVCLGCDLLSESSRADATTCSPACRVRVHRHPELRDSMAEGARQASKSSGHKITLASIMQTEAARRLCPEFVPALRAGDLRVEDIRGNIATAFWQRATKAALAMRESC